MRLADNPRMIEITGVDLVELVQRVYTMSQPVGLGVLHYTPKPLSRCEAEEYIISDGTIVINLDYVRGRCCKFSVRSEDNKLYTERAWYDHTDNELKYLLGSFGIRIKEFADHYGSCNCIDCVIVRNAPKAEE
jgi:hypothetical protein